MLIAVFTKVRHWAFSLARLIQSALSHTISLRFILILSSYLSLGISSGFFPSDFLVIFCVHVSFIPYSLYVHPSRLLELLTVTLSG